MLSRAVPAFDAAVTAPDLETPVCQQEAEDLPTGVPAGTGDCRAVRHAA